MTHALKLYIREWRCTELLGVLNYLHNLKGDLRAETGAILHIPNKYFDKKHVKAVIERLYIADYENLEGIEVMASESSTKRQYDDWT